MPNKIVIGLGNPDKQHAGTLHNAGALVLDSLNLSWEKAPKNIPALISKMGNVIYAKPTTYMNASGGPTQQLLAYYKLYSQDLIVIHDDIDLAMGDVRAEESRGAGGHNGIKSIISSLGGDKTFVRIRVGVATKRTAQKDGRQRNVAKIVLKKPGRFDRGSFRATINLAAEELKKAVQNN